MKSDKSKEFLKEIKLPLSALDFMTIRNGMESGVLSMKDLPEKLRKAYSVRHSIEFDREMTEMEERGERTTPTYG